VYLKTMTPDNTSSPSVVAETSPDADGPSKRARPAAAAITDALVEIGMHVKRARKKAFKESREAFAARIGCSPMTLDRIERGDPGVAVVYLMAALNEMAVLRDVTEAASPKVLIATLLPVSFPPGFDGIDD
jgi:DNA-binding XRE family transcriptional regulator